MFIFNVLLTHELRSPESQFAMVNVCVLSMYYHVLLFQISDDRQRTPGNWSESSRTHSIRPHTWCESREINQIRTNFNKSSIFLFKTLVRQDPAPCLCELRESRSLKLRFAKPPILYSLHNILTLYILLQDNSLQFKATIYQCVVTMDKNELILILQNANFPNFRPTFKAQAV